MVAVGMALALWVAFTVVQDLWARTANKPQRVAALFGQPASVWGMVLGHLGIAVFVVGVTLSKAYSTEEDVRMAPGQTLELGGYGFQLVGVRETPGPNYTAHEGLVIVSRDGEEVTRLYPQKRVYSVQGMPMTEAAIDPGLTRDLYVALGEPLPNGDWAVRLYHKPFVRWIWFGALFMALGGVLAAADRRYRILKRGATVPAGAVGAIT